MSAVELVLGSLVAVLGGGNVWNWIASRNKTKVDLIQLGQTISGEIIAALKSERQELLAKIDALEANVRDLKHDVRGLQQHVEALEAVIRDLGAVPPPRPKRKVVE